MASTSNSNSGIGSKTNNRVEIWRQEVSDAIITLPREQQDETAGSSSVRRPGFWSKLLRSKVGKSLPEQANQTGMYKRDEQASEKANVVSNDGDESLVLRSESTEPDALRSRRERLERAARLATASKSKNEGKAA